MRKRFRGNQAAIMVGHKHVWPLSGADWTLLTGQGAAREKKGRRRKWAMTHLGCAACRLATRIEHACRRSLINPPRVPPSPVPTIAPHPSTPYTSPFYNNSTYHSPQKHRHVRDYDGGPVPCCSNQSVTPSQRHPNNVRSRYKELVGSRYTRKRTR